MENMIIFVVLHVLGDIWCLFSCACGKWLCNEFSQLSQQQYIPGVQHQRDMIIDLFTIRLIKCLMWGKIPECSVYTKDPINETNLISFMFNAYVYICVCVKTLGHKPKCLYFQRKKKIKWFCSMSAHKPICSAFHELSIDTNYAKVFNKWDKTVRVYIYLSSAIC